MNQVKEQTPNIGPVDPDKLLYLYLLLDDFIGGLFETPYREGTTVGADGDGTSS